jgi:hypothetical protein
MQEIITCVQLCGYISLRLVEKHLSRGFFTGFQETPLTLLILYSILGPGMMHVYHPLSPDPSFFHLLSLPALLSLGGSVSYLKNSPAIFAAVTRQGIKGLWHMTSLIHLLASNNTQIAVSVQPWGVIPFRHNPCFYLILTGCYFSFLSLLWA